MTEDLLAALKTADTIDEIAIAFSVGLEAAYTSHPRDGAEAAIRFLSDRVAFREKAKAEAAAERAAKAAKKSKETA